MNLNTKRIILYFLLCILWGVISYFSSLQSARQLGGVSSYVQLLTYMNMLNPGFIAVSLIYFINPGYFKKIFEQLSWKKVQFRYVLLVLVCPSVLNTVLKYVYIFYINISHIVNVTPALEAPYLIFQSLLNLFIAAMVLFNPNFIYFAIKYSIIEEIGLRRYALPKLQKIVGLFPTGLIIGILYLCWQIVVLYLLDCEINIKSLFGFALYIISSSIIFTWVYHRSGGSLLLCILMHTWSNALSQLRMEAAIGWVLAPAIMPPFESILEYNQSASLSDGTFYYNIFDIVVNVLIAIKG